MRSTTLAAPLLLALQRAILERGGWPLLRIALPGEDEGFFAAARDAHLDGFPPLALAEAQGADASLAILAPENTRALARRRPRAHRPRGARTAAGPRGGACAPLVR